MEFFLAGDPVFLQIPFNPEISHHKKSTTFGFITKVNDQVGFFCSFPRSRQDSQITSASKLQTPKFSSAFQQTENGLPNPLVHIGSLLHFHKIPKCSSLEYVPTLGLVLSGPQMNTSNGVWWHRWMQRLRCVDTF